MKQFFMILWALAITCNSSAQYRNNNGTQRNTDVSHFPAYSEIQSNSWYDIERAYDNRIDAVENNAIFSPHQKRKMIRSINEERKIHFKAFKKSERKKGRRQYRYYTSRY